MPVTMFASWHREVALPTLVHPTKQKHTLRRPTLPRFTALLNQPGNTRTFQSRQRHASWHRQTINTMLLYLWKKRRSDRCNRHLAVQHNLERRKPKDRSGAVMVGLSSPCSRHVTWSYSKMTWAICSYCSCKLRSSPSCWSSWYVSRWAQVSLTLVNWCSVERRFSPYPARWRCPRHSKRNWLIASRYSPS